MRELLLEPSQILTGQFPIQDIEKINEYYSKINSNQKIEPILVTHVDIYNLDEFKEKLTKYKSTLNDFNKSLLDETFLKRKFDYWKHFGTEYILSDGNHRTTSYILSNMKVASLEIENSDDVKLINEKFKKIGKKGPWIFREGKSLDEILFEKYKSYTLHQRLRPINFIIKNLIQTGELKIEKRKVIYNPNLPF